MIYIVLKWKVGGDGEGGVLVVKKEGRGERKEVINGISKGKLLY